MSDSKPASVYDQLSRADKEAVDAVIGRDLAASSDPVLQRGHQKFLKVAFHDPGFTVKEAVALETFIETKRLEVAADPSALEGARAYKAEHRSISPTPNTRANDFLIDLNGDDFTPQSGLPVKAASPAKAER